MHAFLFFCFFVFHRPAAVANLIGPKISIAPIRVEDIFECLPGGDVAVLDQLTLSTYACLTLLAKGLYLYTGVLVMSCIMWSTTLDLQL